MSCHTRDAGCVWREAGRGGTWVEGGGEGRDVGGGRRGVGGGRREAGCGRRKGEGGSWCAARLKLALILQRGPIEPEDARVVVVHKHPKVDVEYLRHDQLEELLLHPALIDPILT